MVCEVHGELPGGPAPCTGEDDVEVTSTTPDLSPTQTHVAGSPLISLCG